MRSLWLLPAMFSTVLAAHPFAKERAKREAEIAALGPAIPPSRFVAAAERLKKSRDPLVYSQWIALVAKADQRHMPKEFVDAAVEYALQAPGARGFDAQAIEMDRILEIAEAGAPELAVRLFNERVGYCHFDAIPKLVALVPSAKYVQWLPPGATSPVGDQCRIDLKK